MAVLGSPSLTVLVVSVDVKQHWTWTKIYEKDGALRHSTLRHWQEPERVSLTFTSTLGRKKTVVSTWGVACFLAMRAGGADSMRFIFWRLMGVVAGISPDALRSRFPCSLDKEDVTTECAAGLYWSGNSFKRLLCVTQEYESTPTPTHLHYTCTHTLAHTHTTHPLVLDPSFLQKLFRGHHLGRIGLVQFLRVFLWVIAEPRTKGRHDNY